MAKTKTMAITKTQKSGALAPLEDWEVELQTRAKDEKASEVLGIPRITHRGGILKVDDKAVVDNKLTCAIVTYGLVKTYYESGFDPDSPSATPSCYAFAEARPGEEAKMIPHDAAPGKQNEQCSGCPHNAFGSGKGRGKRCNDRRRVFVIVGTKDKDSIVQAQVRQIEVPPGSLKNWGNYQKAVEEVSPVHGLRGVLTQISTQPLDTGAYALTFKATEKLDKEFVKAIVAKEKVVKNDLFTPYPVITQEEKPKSKKRVKGQD